MKRKSMFQLSGLIRSGFLWPWRYTAFIVSSSSRPATPCSLSGVRLFQSALQPRPCFREAFLVRIGVLNDEPLQRIGIACNDPEAYRSTVILDEKAVTI